MINAARGSESAIDVYRISSIFKDRWMSEAKRIYEGSVSKTQSFGCLPRKRVSLDVHPGSAPLQRSESISDVHDSPDC